MVGVVMSSVARLISGTVGRWVNSEPSTRQRVYYANHSSHFDILVLWASLPREVRRMTRPVAARDYWETNRLRRYLIYRVFNAIVIDREGADSGFRAAYQSIEATLKGMGETYSVILFPEGTRGEGETIAPFKGGIHLIAKSRPGIEFIPVYLENLNRILPKGEVFPIPLVSSISFGPPVVLQPGEKKPDFLERAHRALMELKEM